MALGIKAGKIHIPVREQRKRKYYLGFLYGGIISKFQSCRGKGKNFKEKGTWGGGCIYRGIEGVRKGHRIIGFQNFVKR